jgi:hypothetical protein
MKFTIAAIAFAFAGIADAATSAVVGTVPTKKLDGIFANTFKVVWQSDSHTAADDEFRITLPTGVEVKNGALKVADSDIEFKCKNAAGDAETVTDDQYTVTYDKSTRIVTAKSKGVTGKYCLTGADAYIAFKKAGILSQTLAKAELKVGNSIVSASEAIASTTDIAAYGTATKTLADLKIPETAKSTSTFELKITTAVAVATDKFIKVILPGYVVKDPKCKIGTKDVPTADISGGQFDSHYGWILIKGSTDLWAAAANTLTCATGVTANAAPQAAQKVHVAVGATDTISEFTSTDGKAIKSAAPTRAPTVPTRAPTRAFSAAPHSAAAAGAGLLSSFIVYFLF